MKHDAVRGTDANQGPTLGGRQSVKVSPRDLTDTRWRRP